jgi:ABC-type phosphate transport system substrate-binding protein
MTMSAAASWRPFALWRLLLLAVAGLLGFAGLAVLVLLTTTVPPSIAVAQDLPSRQVTLFGVLATPGSTTIDPQLKSIAPQLRKLLPGHGFKLLEVQSKRLGVGQSVACDKLNQYSAEAGLLDPLDDNGKVQIRFALGYQGQMQAATIVTTPPNQLFFFDKVLEDGSRLLIGIGAR